jgi:hypothetical protein
MVSPAIQKALVIIVLILLLGYLGYSTFIVSTPVTNEVVVPSSEIVGQDILALVNQLQNLSIDKSIFSSPLFTSLVDLSTEIFPELRGRTNPFAPIGSN